LINCRNCEKKSWNKILKYINRKIDEK